MPTNGGLDPWPYAVTLDEVKLHGNITTDANDDELLGFIGTAQQMVEQLVGITVPQTFTQTVTDSHRCHGGYPYPTQHPYLWPRQQPLLDVTSVTESGATVDPSLYLVDTEDGTIVRTDRRGWYGVPEMPLTFVYRAGRLIVAEGICWGIKELTIHLWRSTQTQRGGRARGDTTETVAAGYGLPNRVRDALAPFLLAPAVG